MAQEAAAPAGGGEPAAAPAAAPLAAAGDGGGGGNGGEQGGIFGNAQWGPVVMQMVMVFLAMNTFGQGRSAGSDIGRGLNGTANGTANRTANRTARLENLYGSPEECGLWVHLSLNASRPPLAAVLDEALGAAEGLQLLWHERVRYEESPAPSSKNVSVGPFSEEVLNGTVLPFVHATLVRTELLEGGVGDILPHQVVTQSLALVAMLRELRPAEQAGSLFAGEDDPRPAPNMSAGRLPYFKTKVEVRPVFDQTVQSTATVKTPPLDRLRIFPELGVYQPYLYVSDFWLLEKDYVLLNNSLTNATLNLSLTYTVASLMAWTMQAHMVEQWGKPSDFQLSDPQNDAFMLKRLILDTNPYYLAFSGCFIAVHMLFSMLAFKNDVQFWKNNESMEGLSARSMIVSFVCQLIQVLYLLDSQEASRLILFQIVLELALATWKLRKAVNVKLEPTFPFISMGSQAGYESAGTKKYDEEATHYMFSVLTPVFVGYVIWSAIYGKHRGWYSFLVRAAAGGMYTFGFIMMTPQLYINYKLQSVDHLPHRALIYKAMNTFVDDVAAFLIDMPMMHRLSCLRDDVIFFVYIYQRWKYRVDKTRPSMWVESATEDPGADGAKAEPKEGATRALEPSAER